MTTYDRSTILGLKLRSAMYLRKLTRAELLGRMQLLRTIDPITQDAYNKVEDEAWRSQTDDSPHGHPWHVSFHASQFPGDDAMACSRQALYRMMDFAPPEPFRRSGRTVMDAGKAIEVSLVRTWEKAGILLSASPDDPLQTGFEVPEAWLTGSVDSIIKAPKINRPLPVEVKTKYQADIDKMKLGAKGPDDSHVRQLKTQLALIRQEQERGGKWSDMEPVTHGFIYYLSRDRPSDTAEFRVDYDKRFFDIGIARLRKWRAMFEEGLLPIENSSKKHPMGWRWSYLPCQWCDFKKTCQADFKEGISDLSESTGVGRTQKIRPHYDPEAARQRVLARWKRPSARITESQTAEPKGTGETE